MKVLLLSYNHYEKRCIKVSEKDYKVNIPFPAAISYLGSILAEHELEFKYIIYGKSGKQKLIDMLSGVDFDYVAISSTFIVQMDILRELACVIRNNSKAKIIVGGPFIASKCKVIPQKELQIVLKYCQCDIYISSFQGEEVFLDILLGKNMREIPNIFYWDGKNFIFTFEKKQITNLEQKINWSLFGSDELNYVNVRTSNSCPYNCSFCAFPKYAGQYRERRIESLIEELDLLDKEPNVKVVHFIDDTLNANMSRFKQILRIMIEKKYHFFWHGYLRCQLLDEEAVCLMRDSKCLGVLLGIESGSNVVLQAMNKKSSIADVLKGHSLLKKHGIKTIASFFIGFPCETRATVEETIDFINLLEPDFYEVRPWFYNTGTPIDEQRNKYGLTGAGNNYKHNTMTSEEAAKLCETAFEKITNSIRKNVADCEMFQLAAYGISWDEIKKYCV